MKVLITGDRNWSCVESVVDALSRLPTPSVVIHGDAPGADTIAGFVAEALKLQVRAYPAKWDLYKKGAGPIRNQEMLDKEHLENDPIDVCFAFHDDLSSSRGTADMVRRAKKADIEVCVFNSKEFCLRNSAKEWRSSKPQAAGLNPAGDAKYNMSVIDSFRGDFRFLSNFYPQEIEIGGRKYPSSEHAYQAFKCLHEADHERVRSAKTPAESKKMIRDLEIRPNWHDVKVNVMRSIIQKKFEVPYLREFLLATEDAELIEGNTWGDVFWGVCKGKGQNWLGRLLSEERSRITQNSETISSTVVE